MTNRATRRIAISAVDRNAAAAIVHDVCNRAYQFRCPRYPAFDIPNHGQPQYDRCSTRNDRRRETQSHGLNNDNVPCWKIDTLEDLDFSEVHTII